MMPEQAISHYRILESSGAAGWVSSTRPRTPGSAGWSRSSSSPRAGARSAGARAVPTRGAGRLGALNHPNICTIYDIGEHDGQPFIVMEFLEGQTLEHRSSTRRAPRSTDPRPRRSRSPTRSTPRTRKGIIHRDIKPANIFVTERARRRSSTSVSPSSYASRRTRPTARIDANRTMPSAQLTSPGRTIGTAAYMSPEQARGEDLDARTDLFSFGVVLYEMATGDVPFRGATPAAIFDAILNRAPLAPVRLNPELPPKLERIIHSLARKGPRPALPVGAGPDGPDLKRLRRELESGSRMQMSAPESFEPERINGRRISDRATPQPTAGDKEAAAPIPGASERFGARARHWKLLIPAAVAVALVAGGVLWLSSGRATTLSETRHHRHCRFREQHRRCGI